jgi:hypothetical protein
MLLLRANNLAVTHLWRAFDPNLSCELMEPKANGFVGCDVPRVVAVEHVHSNSRAIV